MDVLQWCDIEECIFIAETDEVYKKYAGLKHSNELILSLANLRLLNSKLFLKNYVKPHDLFLSVVENFVDSSTKDLDLSYMMLEQRKLFLSINSIMRISIGLHGGNLTIMKRILTKGSKFLMSL